MQEQVLYYLLLIPAPALYSVLPAPQDLPTHPKI